MAFNVVRGLLVKSHKSGGGGGVTSIPSHSFDFGNNIANVGGISGKPSDYITCTRSTAARAVTSGGMWNTFAANTLRWTDVGLLIEATRTNGLINNTMVGAVAGTPGTAPLNAASTSGDWVVSSAVGGLTRTINGMPVVDGIKSIDMRFVAADYTGVSNFVRPGHTLEMDAVAGNTVTASIFCAPVDGIAGSENTMDFEWAIYECNAAGTAVVTDVKHITIPTTTLGLSRHVYTRILTAATTVKVMAGLQIGGTGSVLGPQDYRLYYGEPQIEIGACATSPIATANAAATRNADVATMDFTPGTVGSIRVVGRTPAALLDATLFSITDGIDNDDGYIIRRDIAGFFHALVYRGGAQVLDLIAGEVANDQSFNITFIWDGSAHIVKLDGNTVVSGNTIAPLGMTKFKFGGDNTTYWNSTIQSVDIYPDHIPLGGGSAGIPYMNVVASAAMPVGYANVTAGKEQRQERNWYVVGKSTVNQLIWTATGWHGGGNTCINASVGHDTTISNSYWEIPTPPIIIPMTFNGFTSGTIRDGEVEFRSDPLTPAMVGVADFPEGFTFAVQTVRTAPTGGKHPQNVVFTHIGDSCVEGPVGATIQTGTTAAFTATGGSTTDFPRQRAPVILGLAPGGTKVTNPSFLTLGDSSADGTLDNAGSGIAASSTAELNGGGYSRRATWNVNGHKWAISSLAINASSVDNFLNGMIFSKQYFKYFSHVMIGYGNVQLLQGAATSATMLLLTRLFLTLKANNIQWIAIQRIWPRMMNDGSHPNGSNDNFLTLAGQLIFTGYETGGTLRDPLNTALIASVGTNGLNATVDTNQYVAHATSKDKWIVDGVTPFLVCGDGVHCNPNGQLLCKNALRPILEALVI